MLEPLVSRLVLAGDGHGTALLRSASTRPSAPRVPSRRARPGPHPDLRRHRDDRLRPRPAAPPAPSRSRCRPGASRWSGVYPAAVAAEAAPPRPFARTHDHDPRTRSHVRPPQRPRRVPPRPVPPLRPEPDPDARGATAGSPRASTTRPRWSRTARWCCSTAPTPTTSSSHVGLATSEDGIHFERHPEPVLSPTEPYEEFGAEDPRVTEIDGTYYLTYTGWDRKSAQLCLATSTDLYTWTKHGPMFPDFNTFLPQGNGQDAPVEQGRRDPAGPDRRPLPDVLRRGLDLPRVVRRPRQLEALLQRRAADGPDADRARSGSSWSRSGRRRSSPTTG